MTEYALMTEADVDAVHEIEVLSFRTPWSRESFLREANENQCARYIVAKEEGRVVAYAGVWFIVDEGHITNIAVHPDYRRQGIGEGVTRAMLQLAADSGMVWMTLEVRRSNAAARALYHKLGFIDIGVRRNYYENSEDAVLMAIDHMPESHPENDPFLLKEE